MSAISGRDIVWYSKRIRTLTLLQEIAADWNGKSSRLLKLDACCSFAHNCKAFHDFNSSSPWANVHSLPVLHKRRFFHLIVKVNNNYHKKIYQNPLRHFLKSFIAWTILYVEDWQITTRWHFHKISFHVTSKVMTSQSRAIFNYFHRLK